MANLVEDKRIPGRLIPKAFVKVDGVPTCANTIMVSNLMWRHMMRSRKNTRAKKEECPFLEPDTENTYIQTCFGIMKEDFDWNYSVDHDFNFERGLAPKMNMLWTEITKKWLKLGTGNNVQDAGMESTKEIKLAILDEADNIQFRQKSLISMGGFLAFRGNEEHAKLPVNCIKFGTFEEGHKLAGQMYVETKVLLEKSFKLSLSRGRN